MYEVCNINHLNYTVDFINELSMWDQKKSWFKILKLFIRPNNNKNQCSYFKLVRLMDRYLLIQRQKLLYTPYYTYFVLYVRFYELTILQR